MSRRRDPPFARRVPTGGRAQWGRRRYAGSPAGRSATPWWQSGRDRMGGGVGLISLNPAFKAMRRPKNRHTPARVVVGLTPKPLLGIGGAEHVVPEKPHHRFGSGANIDPGDWGLADVEELPGCIGPGRQGHNDCRHIEAVPSRRAACRECSAHRPEEDRGRSSRTRPGNRRCSPAAPGSRR